MKDMNDSKWQIFTGAEKLDSDIGFVFNLQKAMLLALLEDKKLNLRQYESAIELLKKKKLNL